MTRIATSPPDRRSLGATLRWGRTVLLLALAALLHTGAAAGPAEPAASPAVGVADTPNVRQDLPTIRDMVRMAAMADRGKLPPLLSGGGAPHALPAPAPVYPAGIAAQAWPATPERAARQVPSPSSQPRAPPLAA